MGRKKRIGRPPALWVHEIANLAKRDDQSFDVYELCEVTGVPVGSLKAFIRKAEVRRKHETNNGQVKAIFKVKDLKKAAKAYLEPWV